jgi:serine/threonine-protein kinase HipA
MKTPVWVNRPLPDQASQVLAGVIDRTESRRFVFTYDLQCKNEDAISLTMPVETESYLYDELHPVFQMNLPEGELRRTILLQFSKAIPGFDDLAMLRLLANSHIGRLRYYADPSQAKAPPQSIKEILHAKDTQDLLHTLMERYAASSGISGVQPKVLLCDQDTHVGKGRVTAFDATHIVKTFDPKEFPELAANEFFCMQVASQAGLAIPHLQLSDTGRFLVIERFDRLKDDVYLGFEDFCSLYGVGTSRKYDASYEQLAKRIAEFVDPAQREQALETFFTSFVVSCIVQNGDAHLKNFGVLYASAESPVSFAPTYDIVSTKLYIPSDTLALTLGGSKRFPNARKLHDFGRLHCGLTNEQVALILERVADAVSATRIQVNQYMRDRSEFKEIGQRLMQCWDAGLKLSLPTSTVLTKNGNQSK